MNGAVLEFSNQEDGSITPFTGKYEVENLGPYRWTRSIKVNLLGASSGEDFVDSIPIFHSVISIGFYILIIFLLSYVFFPSHYFCDVSQAGATHSPFSSSARN